MTDRAPLPPIRFEALAEALLARAHNLLPAWMPGGDFKNQEYLVHSPFRAEKTPSMSVRVSGERAGQWADFGGSDRGGDLISLYAALHQLEMGKAAVQVARDEGLEDVAGVTRNSTHERTDRPPAPPAAPPPYRAPDEGWTTVRPVPLVAPKPTFKHPHRKLEDLDHQAEYRSGEDLHGYVMRFRTSDGGKDTLPYSFCMSARDGTLSWKWKQFDEPRPLYLPGLQLPGERTVVLVEGERKADILQRLLDATAPGIYCVASWPGGSKAWKKADWSWLGGRHVLLWPDCDGKREQLTNAEKKAELDKAAQIVLQQSKPLLPASKQVGMVAMVGIGAHLRDAHGCTVQMLPIPAPGEVDDGWDCADAITTDGWDGERVLAFFGQAQPFNDEPAAKPVEPSAAGSGDGGGGKKIDALADADQDDGRHPWWLAPYWDDKKQFWRTSRKLVIAALNNDAGLKDVLGLNLLSNNIDARRKWPWEHGKPGPITGSVDLMMGKYLSDTYGLPAIPRAALMEAIETVAHAAPYHPVQDLLKRIEHDGESRIDKWLVHVIGETPQTLPPSLYKYLCLVGRFWLLGMVYRVMEPGCKFDYCPVLEGPGGLGKSTLVETLCGSEWFSDTHFDPSRGKEGQEQVQGLWVYEIAELANFSKAEIGVIKAFISAKVDRYRPSYGRVVESYMRQCLLVGTTNENTYLRDRTGNRRFWPTPVRNRVKIGWLAKMREQLLAEAYALYLKGERYTPTPEEEKALFVPMQDKRLVETAVLSELMTLLTRPPKDTGIGSLVNELTTFVTISQLTTALGVDAAKSTPALEAQIRSWMDHEGWARVKRQVGGVRAWGYERPAKWPTDDEAEGFDEVTPPPPPPAAGESAQDDDDAPF
ncbi:MAG: virulence protein E [Burkholderiales bacterium]|nr:MAG: virulence protein E [Burkholderiales bacterium]